MSSTLCYLVTAVVALAAVMVASQGIGHLAPLVPQEFTAEMRQHKFNHNGFGVNHNCTGSYTSSYSQNMIRQDIAVDGVSGMPLVAANGFCSSIFDFNSNTNTEVCWESIGATPTCYLGPFGYLPPMKDTYLRDVNAVFFGTQPDPIHTTVARWQFLPSELPNTVVTVYVTESTPAVVTRVDITSNDKTQGAVGVVMEFFNVAAGPPSLLPKSLFTGAGVCPNYTVPLSSSTLPLA